MTYKIEDLKFWQFAVAVCVGASLIAAVIFVLVGMPEQAALDRERASIEPGFLTDSNGNRFKPKHKCFRNSCAWVLERVER